MNPKAILTIAVIVTVAATGVAWNLAQAARTAEASVARLQTRRAALGAELQRDADQARALGERAAELRTERDHLQAAKATADAAEAGNRPASPRPMASPIEQMH